VSKLPSKRVLVTGACGTVGKELVKQLLEEHHVLELIALDNNESELFLLEQHFSQHPHASFFLADIRDRDKLTNKMQGINIVFHAAAYKHVTLCERSPFEIDTLQCVRIALEHPPDNGELKIFNQFTETFSVNDLAERIQEVGKDFNLNVQIQHMDNPRKEAEKHYYNPRYTGLLELGLQPNYLTRDVLGRMIEYVMKYQDNIREDQIFRKVKWD